MTESKRVRCDRNFRLAIPSLIVNNHRPGFPSAQLLIRHGSHSILHTSPKTFQDGGGRIEESGRRKKRGKHR